MEVFNYDTRARRILKAPKLGDSLLIYRSENYLTILGNTSNMGILPSDQYSFRVKSLKNKEVEEDGVVSGDNYPPAY